MASNAQKTPLTRTLSQHARKRIEDAFQIVGKFLPASVAAIPTAGVPIVTVKFELNAQPFTLPQVTVPIEGFEFIRFPVQVGTQGWVKAADASLHQMSGLGSGTADLTQQANLATLVFSPLGNKSWQAFDANTLTLYGGSNGVLIQDAASPHASEAINQNGCTLTYGGNKLVINSGGITITGTLTVDGGPIINNGTTVIVP